MTTDMKNHIVSAYDQELARLNGELYTMTKLVLNQLNGALQALAKLDNKAAQAIYLQDEKIDEAERNIDALMIEILAKWQPMADDLRFIVMGLKLANSLARIGDYAKNIARRVLLVRKVDDGTIDKNIERMATMVTTMIADVMTALEQRKADEMQRVWETDSEVDALFTVLNRTLITYILSDARSITACAHLMFVAKNLERIGDHATNMAEHGYFYLTGQVLQKVRPKTTLFDKELTPLKKKKS